MRTPHVQNLIDHLQEKIKFYEKFTTKQQWNDWINSPEGTWAVLNNDWKAIMPAQFREGNLKAEEILKIVRKQNEKPRT